MHDVVKSFLLVILSSSNSAGYRTSQPSLETSRLSRPDAFYTLVFVTNPSLQLIGREDFKRRKKEKKREGG